MCNFYHISKQIDLKLFTKQNNTEFTRRQQVTLKHEEKNVSYRTATSQLQNAQYLMRVKTNTYIVQAIYQKHMLNVDHGFSGSRITEDTIFCLVILCADFFIRDMHYFWKQKKIHANFKKWCTFLKMWGRRGAPRVCRKLYYIHQTQVMGGACRRPSNQARMGILIPCTC